MFLLSKDINGFIYVQDVIVIVIVSSYALKRANSGAKTKVFNLMEGIKEVNLRNKNFSNFFSAQFSRMKIRQIMPFSLLACH